MYSFPNLEPVCCSMSSSSCCFLTCIHVSQEADTVVSYPISLRIFQFLRIHTVKGFSIVNEAEVDFFVCFQILLLLKFIPFFITCMLKVIQGRTTGLTMHIVMTHQMILKEKGPYLTFWVTVHCLSLDCIVGNNKLLYTYKSAF